MVFKVLDKMFALVGKKDGYLNMNLKADPTDAIVFRDIYTCVQPGYHMNKKHWNTIVLDGSMPEPILIDMINDSYSLVVDKMNKRKILI